MVTKEMEKIISGVNGSAIVLSGEAEGVMVSTIMITFGYIVSMRKEK